MSTNNRFVLALVAGVGIVSLAGCGKPSASDVGGGSAEQAGAPAAPREVKLDPSCDRALAEKAIMQCKVCHSMQEGQPNMTGPNLWGVHGRAAGSVEGFAFSPALREKGVTWDDKTLDAFLTNPQAFVKGTRMAFGGIKDQAARAATICYLKALGE